MTEFDSFFKSAFSVDNVIFGFDGVGLKVLLIKRANPLFENMWALPGDLVYPNEDIQTAASRVLDQLTGLKGVFLEQVRAFGAVDRHPLGRVITIAYYSLVNPRSFKLKPSSFASVAEWHDVHTVGALAFDHNQILESCLEQLRLRVRTAPIGFELLPPKFTLTELQQLYESILATKMDKRNFRKKMLQYNFIDDLGEMQEGVSHRPARLYRFSDTHYSQLVQAGYEFAL
jgi:8-oxo-dGTP diphosphatase